MNPLKIIKQGGRTANENLENEIDRLAGLRMEDDPRVANAKEKLLEFETRAETLRAKIESMSSEHVTLEKEFSDAMLRGEDPKLSKLTLLVSRKVEAETELRLLASVIERSRAAVKQLTEQAAHEQDLRELEAASTAIDTYIEAFESFLEVHAMLEKALNLRALTPFSWRALSEIRPVHEEVVKYRQLILQVTKETRAQ